MIGIRAKGQQESEQQERFSPTEEDRSVLPRKVTGAGVSKDVPPEATWSGVRRLPVGDAWPERLQGDEEREVALFRLLNSSCEEMSCLGETCRIGSPGSCAVGREACGKQPGNRLFPVVSRAPERS